MNDLEKWADSREYVAATQQAAAQCGLKLLILLNVRMTGIYHYAQQNMSIFMSFCPVHLIQLHNVETSSALPNTFLPRLRTVCAEGDLPKKSANEKEERTTWRLAGGGACWMAAGAAEGV